MILFSYSIGENLIYLFILITVAVGLFVLTTSKQGVLSYPLAP